MMYAINSSGEKIEAKPYMKAICPICKKQVTSRCGKINIWHFSHDFLQECDTWSEGETIWHKEWKQNFKKEEQEVIIGRHRADIKINSLIIELQATSISSEEIIEREEYYKNMIWIFNETKNNNINIRKVKLEQNNEGETILIPYTDGFCTFRWKQPKKTLWTCKKQIYLDLGYDEILKINNLYHNIPCGGSGWIINKKDLILNIIKEKEEV